MIIKRLFERGRMVSSTFVLLAAVVFTRLGFWQLHRLVERRQANEQVRAMQALTPLTLDARSAVEGEEYRAVRASGTYDFEHQLALRNQVHDGEYGYHLLTPLRLENQPSESPNAAAILVDRGWIPATGNATREDWRKYDVKGRVNVQGVLRRGTLESTTSEVGEGNGFWISVDLQRMNSQIPYPLMSMYVQADARADVSQLPIAGATAFDLSNGPHLGYAIQWFAFAVALPAVYVRKISRSHAETAR